MSSIPSEPASPDVSPSARHRATNAASSVGASRSVSRPPDFALVSIIAPAKPARARCGITSALASTSAKSTATRRLDPARAHPIRATADGAASGAPSPTLVKDTPVPATARAIATRVSAPSCSPATALVAAERGRAPTTASMVRSGAAPRAPFSGSFTSMRSAPAPKACRASATSLTLTRRSVMPAPASRRPDAEARRPGGLSLAARANLSAELCEPRTTAWASSEARLRLAAPQEEKNCGLSRSDGHRRACAWSRRQV